VHRSLNKTTAAAKLPGSFNHDGASHVEANLGRLREGSDPHRNQQDDTRMQLAETGLPGNRQQQQRRKESRSSVSAHREGGLTTALIAKSYEHAGWRLTLLHDAALDIPPVRSKPSHEQQDDENDQNDADDADATVTVAVAIAAEAATEATEQKNDEDDNENESQRHDLISR
jgi:hypothetical protein